MKVLAAVGLTNQVLGVREFGELQPSNGLLCDAHSDGCMGLQARAQFFHPLVELRNRDYLRCQSGGQGLLGRERSGGEDQLFGAGGPDQGHKARVVLDGEAVPQSACYGYPKLRVRRTQSQVADSRDAQATPDRVPVYYCDGGLAHPLQAADDTLHPLLVGDAVLLTRFELQELLDVRSGSGTDIKQ